MQVVPVNDQIPIEIAIPDGFLFIDNKGAIRQRKVMGKNEFLAFELNE
jgi:hypothetical protein